MSAPTIPSDFVSRAVQLAAAEGVDLAPALDAARISRAVLAQPHARLTPEQVSRFTQVTWQITDDELFGLGSGPVPRGSFRVMCLTLIHCPDLSHALTRMIEVNRVMRTLPTLTLTPGPETTFLDVGLPDVVTEKTRVTVDFLLMLLHRFAAWLVGGRVRLESVEMPYPQPDPVLARSYDAIFGVPVTFGADRAALEIDNAALRSPLVQTESGLEEYLRESPNLMLSERDYESTASAQVRRIFESGIKGRTASAEDIADMLSVSAPHLRRLLRQEGTSLGHLREEVLRDAAIAGLRRGESVDDLSARLGFSEPSAFRRAFKRWTGSTPRSFR
ncbi:AraC family transcriptional regulator [Rhodococcus sp. HM1]|uniref:AraC family transcriptional regulator n=1 Tax=unclassified Rhodococcus (in: high G+C Gram-positive bacteria) TaxID=192944 RepID=UPI0018CF1565|nr:MULTISPECIES: AraC family transcriptional regulator [unclassified Rhodococcus (in: high G+C Gram-positive bacteria)]MBH0118061.1 AraC family transcriptional regulator [Rhodococcus sp. CX]MCK8672934.1 AraC family transcriptional regulator [Rhodococcus sp. HM1]